MAGPSFAPLVGRPMWARCDHDGTRIEGQPGRVTLAPRDDAPPAVAPLALSAGELAAWRARLGSTVTLPCPPDRCVDARQLLAVPGQPLCMLTPDGWRSLRLPADSVPSPAGGEVDFSPWSPVAAAPAAVDAIACDPSGRLWLLERAGKTLRRLGADLRVSASVSLPADCAPAFLACAAFGLLVSDRSQPRLFCQRWDGGSREWQGYALPDARPGDEIVALCADPRFPVAVALLRGSGRRPRLLCVSADAALIWELPLVREPLHLLLTAPDTLLLADLAHLPDDARPTFFREFHLGASGVEAERGFAVRGFDGRALWLADSADGGRPEAVFASTASGARPLYAREPDLRGSGSVETFALDSGIFACVWHRLFVDLCLPADCSLIVEAKTADDLPPFEIRRGARLPLDVVGETRPAAIDDPWPPLGSLVADEVDGWVRLGVADVRPAHADQPLANGVGERPSADPLAGARGAERPLPAALQTHEWLLTPPPGRYLWLRLRLNGTRRHGPTLFALRASFPRPSLLDYLPAYWRSDAEGAEPTARALALFEAWSSELAQRSARLPALFDPRQAPAEALPWLASFLALTFDGRVREGVRRQLLLEAAELYRARGTLPGMTRLLSLLAEAPVQIVEAFRLRRPTAAFLGDAALGPGLELGGHEGGFNLADAEDWQRELAREHAALLLRRQGEATPCPAAEPPDPLADDALIAFYRRHAHRFTVIVPRACDAPLAAVLERAIECNKPAHTLHRLCWLDAGFRVGRASLVGLSALGPVSRSQPAILGEALLSPLSTLHRGRRDDRPHFANPWEISS